jgi:hypothetical protein
MAGEHPLLDLAGLERTVELPSVIGRVEVMWRDEDLECVLPGRLEEALHVLDRPVLSDAVTDQAPSGALLAQHLVLGIDEDHGGVGATEVHHDDLLYWL